MNKDFLPYEKVRNNSLKLAHQIHQDGFIPDVIYISLRGGAYIGNIISEYFKIVRKKERPVFLAAVVARSYTDIRENSKVMIDGWTYDPKHLRHGDKVLLVDDIFDTGNTMNYLAEVIMEQGIPRSDLKVAVHDYKRLLYNPDQVALPVQPDYYCRKHVIESKETDVWIHYMSHELVGLSEQELNDYYYKNDDELRNVLDKDFFK